MGRGGGWALDRRDDEEDDVLEEGADEGASGGCGQLDDEDDEASGTGDGEALLSTLLAFFARNSFCLSRFSSLIFKS